MFVKIENNEVDVNYITVICFINLKDAIIKHYPIRKRKRF